MRVSDPLFLTGQDKMIRHLSQPTHLGTLPKTPMGIDREPTMYKMRTK